MHWNVGQAQDYESDRGNLRARAERVFTGSEAILGRLGRGVSVSEVGGGEVPVIGQAEVCEFSVQVSAVAAGRKPLFHENFGLTPGVAAETANELQRLLPPGVVAREDRDHLYVYHPTALAHWATPQRQLWPQVLEHSDDGKWLGYGANHLRDETVMVWITNSAQDRVSGFRAPKARAELYAAARARDWANATGEPYSYTIIR